MSDDIYDDAFGTKTERMEMTVDIYESVDHVRDHDFRTKIHQPLQRTGSDSERIRRYRAVVVCFVLLCVLLLTAVIVLCVYIHTNNTEKTNQLLTKMNNFTEERVQLLNMITSLAEEREQLLNKNMNLTNEKYGLLTKNNNLAKERDQSNLEKSEMFKSLREMDGQIYQSSFYFVSSESKSWTESRRFCTERGADLTIINNREEQEFIKKISGGAGVWIGVTDSDEEDTWKWVDDTLTSGFSFWGTREPNGGRGENCVASFLTGWYDYPCSDAFKWICEKNFKK